MGTSGSLSGRFDAMPVGEVFDQFRFSQPDLWTVVAPVLDSTALLCRVQHKPVPVAEQKSLATVGALQIVAFLDMSALHVSAEFAFGEETFLALCALDAHQFLRSPPMAASVRLERGRAGVSFVAQRVRATVLLARCIRMGAFHVSVQRSLFVVGHGTDFAVIGFGALTVHLWERRYGRNGTGQTKKN